jgi:hypothetical protein
MAQMQKSIGAWGEPGNDVGGQVHDEELVGMNMETLSKYLKSFGFNGH